MKQIGVIFLFSELLLKQMMYIDVRYFTFFILKSSLCTNLVGLPVDILTYGLATSWMIRGSNSGGGRGDFSHPSRPVLGSTHLPIQWVPCLSRG
jgi:hypothetical protein